MFQYNVPSIADLAQVQYSMTVLHLDRRVVAGLAAGAAACFILGALVGHFGSSSSGEGPQEQREERAVQDEDFVKRVLETMDADSIKGFLEILAKEPHIAASERDRYSIIQIKPSKSITW